MLTVDTRFSAHMTKERTNLYVKSSLLKRDLRKCGMMLRNERDGQMGEAFEIFQLLCNLFWL